MKNQAVKIGIIASLLPHLFCCVLPIALSIISLFAPEVAHAHFIPEWVEPWLFVFSGLMLGLSWILVMRDCRCECAHCHGKKHRTQKIILAVITIIFIASIILHMAAHH